MEIYTHIFAKSVVDSFIYYRRQITSCVKQEVIRIEISNNKFFSVEYNTKLNLFCGNTPVYVFPSGKIINPHECCPKCKSRDIIKNGYHDVIHHAIRALGVDAKVGQFSCKRCGHYWSTDRSIIDACIDNITRFIKSLLIGCVRSGLSLSESSNLVLEKVGKTYSEQYILELYNNAVTALKEERFNDASGIYNYDEQYVTVNGKEACRITIKDAVTNKIIADTYAPDAKKDTIKEVLTRYLVGLPVEVFIIDMCIMYPDLFHEIFPKAKIQWCIFHLYKLIWKELTDTYGKNIPLHELNNAYHLFNIFFDHSPELEKLKGILARLDCNRTLDDKNRKDLEKGLRKEFAEFVKQLKKERRRAKISISRRALQESEKLFETIYSQKVIYPKKLQKRIEHIHDNWGRFSLFQHDSRVQPTNNALEQYFASTLAKTDKLSFRSIGAVVRELACSRATCNGQQIFPQNSLFRLLLNCEFLLSAFPKKT